MIIEIDQGIWIETNSMSALSLRPDGAVMAVVDGVTFTVTRFPMEEMLEILRQRDAQKTELAY